MQANRKTTKQAERRQKMTQKLIDVNGEALSDFTGLCNRPPSGEKAHTASTWTANTLQVSILSFQKPALQPLSWALWMHRGLGCAEPSSGIPTYTEVFFQKEVSKPISFWNSPFCVWWYGLYNTDGKQRKVSQRPVLLFYFYKWLFFSSATFNTFECLPCWHSIASNSFQFQTLHYHG